MSPKGDWSHSVVVNSPSSRSLSSWFSIYSIIISSVIFPNSPQNSPGPKDGGPKIDGKPVCSPASTYRNSSPWGTASALTRPSAGEPTQKGARGPSKHGPSISRHRGPCIPLAKAHAHVCRPLIPIPFSYTWLSIQYGTCNHRSYAMSSDNSAYNKNIKLKSSPKGEGFSPRRKH